MTESSTRREFLRQAVALSGAIMVGKFSLNPASKTVPWSYAMCNESMQERSWQEQCQIISDAGYTGIEIAPFSLVEKGVGEISSSERWHMLQVMQDTGIECIGLHWLLSPPPDGLHFTTPDKAVRKRTVEYLDALIDFCADLGGKVMIFGSPNQRGTTQGASIEEAKANFADGLAKVADHADRRDVKVLIEPLSSDQTDVVNTLGEAMEIVNQVNHPAIQTMFDFHNTVDETEPMHVLIEKFFDNIYHIQIQEMDGTYLGTGNAVNDYVQTFQTLKDLGYNRYISLEVFDFLPGGTKIANESMATLNKIERKLK